MIAHTLTGLPVDTAPCLIVWGHGWGQTRHAFTQMMQPLLSRAVHLSVDFPGFGETPPPPESWTTAEYADAMADLIRPYRNVKKIVWVGHSFGGRVGIQICARHPGLIDGMFLIAAAGLPRQRPWPEQIRYLWRVYTFKILKHIVPLLGMNVDDLRRKFGSSDYRSAGPMRSIFVKVIGENLSEQARQVKCPVELVYGEKDGEASPDIGVRLQKLIPKAELTILPGQDHYSVLDEGRHPVIKRLADFMETIKNV